MGFGRRAGDTVTLFGVRGACLTLDGLHHCSSRAQYLAVQARSDDPASRAPARAEVMLTDTVRFARAAGESE